MENVQVKTDEVPDQLPQKLNKIDERSAADQEAQIPQELITEILLCSLVKSLLRFRCVSKSLCTIIDSKEFIYQHHKRSIVENNKYRNKLISRGIPRQTERRCAISVHAFDVDTGLEVNIYKAQLNGYCNGLILLFVDSLKLALWNPSTKQYRNLPLCPIKVPEDGRCVPTGMGLGYDSTRDEYKVVLIEDVMINYNTHDLQVWVFGLRSNSWKKIIQNFPHRKDKFIYFGYFANDCLHWLCKPSGVVEYGFVTFDVANETWVYRTLPQSPQPALHVLDGCLCISYFYEKEEVFIFHIRRKDGTDDKLKWSKLFSITPEVPLLFDVSRFKNVRVLGYSVGNRDKIMMDLGFKFIVYFDLKARCFMTIGIKNLLNSNDGNCHYPFLCYESLVSVGGRQSKIKTEKETETHETELEPEPEPEP